MADDRLACSRSLSMLLTSCDKVSRLPLAISRKPSQNASSRLMLVLWPSMGTERLATEDFMTVHDFAKLWITLGTAKPKRYR